MDAQGLTTSPKLTGIVGSEARLLIQVVWTVLLNHSIIALRCLLGEFKASSGSDRARARRGGLTLSSALCMGNGSDTVKPRGSYFHSRSARHRSGRCQHRELQHRSITTQGAGNVQIITLSWGAPR